MSFRLAALALVVCAVGYGQDNRIGRAARSVRTDRYAAMAPPTSIYTPDCSATAQTPPNPADAAPEDFVELERSMCFGACPAYRVRLYRTGAVDWLSGYTIRVHGDTSKGLANAAQAAELLNRTYSQEFWSACDSYPAGEDSPTYELRISIGDRRKDIRFADADQLEWLDAFTRDIDRVVETHRWFYGDPAMDDLDHMLIEGTLSKQGLTPLMRASTSENLEELERLLASGAPVDEQDASGWTALMYAAGTYQPHVVTALLAAGANPNHTDLAGRTPLMAAAYGAGFEELLPVTSDINHQSQAGLTVLMVLAGRANTETVRLALANGADHTLKTAKGQTAWDYLLQSHCAPVLATEMLSRLPGPSAEGRQQCFELDRLLKLPAR